MAKSKVTRPPAPAPTPPAQLEQTIRAAGEYLWLVLLVMEDKLAKGAALDTGVLRSVVGVLGPIQKALGEINFREIA
jgi:hypothetical protein